MRTTDIVNITLHVKGNQILKMLVRHFIYVVMNDIAYNTASNQFLKDLIKYVTAWYKLFFLFPAILVICLVENDV